VRKRKFHPALGIFLVIMYFFPLICCAQDKKLAQNDAENFIKNANTLVSNMNAEISEKSAQVIQLWGAGNMQEGYRLEGQIKETIDGYKKQLGVLSAPQDCLEFKTVIIRLLDLMGNMHAALSVGDTARYKSMLPRVQELSDEMQQELQKLLKSYKG